MLSPLPPKPNFASQVKPEVINRPPGFYKAIALDVFAVAAAVALSFSYRLYLDGGLNITILVLSIFPFALLSLFETLFTKGFWRRFTVITLEVFALASFFYDQPRNFLLSVVAGAFVFLIWGEIESRRELRNSLDIRFFRVARLHLKKFSTALALVLVLLYLPRFDSATPLVSQPTFDGFFGAAARAVGKIYPEINFNASVGEFAESIARLQLGVDSKFKILPPVDQENTIQFFADQIITSFKKNLGIEIGASKPLNNLFYDFTTTVLGDWQKKSAGGFIIGWAIGVFLIIRGFGTLFYWLTGLIGFFLFHFMIAANIATVLYESHNKEVAEFT